MNLRKESTVTTTSQLTLSTEKRQEALRVATQLFTQNPDWLTFFREVLGVGGVVRRLFITQDDFLAFEQTPEYAEIQQMVSTLRGTNKNPPSDQEPTRVITVRLPKSLHEALRAEAHDHQTSMNKLCISKLLQVLSDDGLTPVEPQNNRLQPPANSRTETTSLHRSLDAQPVASMENNTPQTTFRSERQGGF